MTFELILTASAQQSLKDIRRDVRKAKKVAKALRLLSENPKYPGLHSHPFVNVVSPTGEHIWESYVENDAPAAWRIWWFYGPGGGTITVMAIGPHA